MSGGEVPRDTATDLPDDAWIERLRAAVIAEAARTEQERASWWRRVKGWWRG